MKKSSERGGRTACFGLVRWREHWTLSGPARLGLLAFVGVAGFFLVRGSHAFLAVNAPVTTTNLIIEGWIPRYAMTGYVARAGIAYGRIYTTGGPTVTDRGSHDESDTYASVARNRLTRAGVPAAKLQVVPSWNSQRDRTYGSALALRDWAATNHVPLTAFNIATLGPHARRSRMLFQQAFGPDVQVGVIALSNEEYDAEHWWRYSEGVKELISELAAYLYVRIWFSHE